MTMCAICICIQKIPISISQIHVKVFQLIFLLYKIKSTVSPVISNLHKYLWSHIYHAVPIVGHGECVYIVHYVERYMISIHGYKRELLGLGWIILRGLQCNVYFNKLEKEIAKRTLRRSCRHSTPPNTNCTA